MPAMPRRLERDVRVRANGRILERSKGNEWIVLRRQNQRGCSDMPEQLGSARSRIIIVRTAKAAEARGDHLVEIAHAADAAHSVDWKLLRKKTRLIAHVALEPRDEMALVKEIPPLAQRTGAS